MTSEGSLPILEGSFDLRGACDEHDDSPRSGECAGQILQIDLARETVKDMRRAAQARKPMSIGFGKHLVRSVTKDLSLACS